MRDEGTFVASSVTVVVCIDVDWWMGVWVGVVISCAYRSYMLLELSLQRERMKVMANRCHKTKHLISTRFQHYLNLHVAHRPTCCLPEVNTWSCPMKTIKSA